MLDERKLSADLRTINLSNASLMAMKGSCLNRKDFELQ